MTLETKRIVIAALGGLFLLSLVFVQWMETARRAEEAGLREARVAVPAASQECVDCHAEENPGIVTHWTGSTHAETGVGCWDCHKEIHMRTRSLSSSDAVLRPVLPPAGWRRKLKGTRP